MRRTVVLDVVGLTPSLLLRAPNLARFAAAGAAMPIEGVFPALTCSAQATYATGLAPSRHGIVGNGWYFRELGEVWLWRQSDALVTGEKVWDAAARRDRDFTCAKLFWWYAMNGTTDIAVTPRPIYCADGRKLPDVYTEPASLRETLQRRFGTFPLFHFWGPAADLRSTQWIARAARHVWDASRPTLTLVYLPHLDYDLQRFGPDGPRADRALAEVDEIAGELVEYFERQGARVIVLSEYGITRVRGPIHVNRALRGAGLLAVRDERGRERLDPMASAAFAVADHQIAHVYVRRRSQVGEVARLLESLDGVERVLGQAGQVTAGMGHPRGGELLAIAAPDRWLSYYYWLDERRAPDFARIVDIHQKPGYDPAELFLDPALVAPRARIALRLLQRALGFRALMDVVPLDAGLVRGSHGRLAARAADGPVFVTNAPELMPQRALRATDVKEAILSHVFDEPMRVATSRRLVAEGGL